MSDVAVIFDCEFLTAFSVSPVDQVKGPAQGLVYVGRLDPGALLQPAP